MVAPDARHRYDCASDAFCNGGKDQGGFFLNNIPPVLGRQGAAPAISTGGLAGTGGADDNNARFTGVQNG